jgi:hypothetical protein
MEILRKKNQTEFLTNSFSQMNNTVEGHFSRLEQVEDRISELENKIDIKDKREELSQTTQEL